MKIIDNIPIIIIIAALLINIAIGVNNNIDFSILMLRCIAVTVIFGVFGYMLTETIKNVLECSRLSKLAPKKSEVIADMEEKFNNKKNMSVLDIKVPPLDDEEYISMDNDSNNGFVEVNPAYMSDYNKGKQD